MTKNRSEKLVSSADPPTHKENFSLNVSPSAKGKEKRVNCESGLSGERGQSIVCKYAKVIFWWRLINCPQSFKDGQAAPNKKPWERKPRFATIYTVSFGENFTQTRKYKLKALIVSWVSQAKKVIYGSQLKGHEHNCFQTEPQ